MFFCDSIFCVDRIGVSHGLIAIAPAGAFFVRETMGDTKQAARNLRNPSPPQNQSFCSPALALSLVASILTTGLLSVATGQTPAYADPQTYTPGEVVDKDFDGFAKSFLANGLDVQV